MTDLEHESPRRRRSCLCILASAVLQLFHDGQRIVHGLVAFAVHHSANAAGIVLELWVVQTKGVFAL